MTSSGDHGYDNLAINHDCVLTSWNDIEFDEQKHHINELKHYIGNALGEFFDKLDIPDDEDIYLHAITFLCSFEIPGVMIRAGFPRHKDDCSHRYEGTAQYKYRQKLESSK